MGIDITKVVLRNGSLEISGVDNTNGEPIDFDIDDIFAGHLSIITDYIPETNVVSDVSQPVSAMPKNDLRCGFLTANDVSQPVSAMPKNTAGVTSTVYLTVRWDIESSGEGEITDDVVDDLIGEKNIYNHSFSAS